jgi:TetR/AcrR family transcriptional repressor of lmrAB and yxaGH operons
VTSPSKQRIEDAAAELLARDGYTGMGLKAISAGAALPYGAIYHHFPGGKEEIAVAAISGRGEALCGLLAALFADGVTARSVRKLFRFMADRLEASGWVDGCPIGTPTLDGSSQSDAVRAACDEALAKMVTAVADALVAGGARRPAATALATTIIATYEGATLLARAQRSGAPLRVTGDAMACLVGGD